MEESGVGKQEKQTAFQPTRGPGRIVKLSPDTERVIKSILNVTVKMAEREQTAEQKMQVVWGHLKRITHPVY